MARSRRLSAVILGLALMITLILQTDMTVQAGTNNYLDELRGGVAAVLDPGTQNVAEIVNAYASNYLLRRTASDIHSIAADVKKKATVLEVNELVEEIVPKKITLKENVEFQYDASPINISIASLQRFQSRK